MVTGSTTIIGVIGDPIAHSLSPAMHNAAIEALGLDWCYVAFRVSSDEVGEAVAGVRGLNMRGINVTVPHKQAVMPFLDEISDEASTIGAVNTIKHEDGRLFGYNTDVYGIQAALRYGAGLHPLPPEVVVLGAGGAARGIVYALVGCEGIERLALLNRTVEKAERLADEMSAVAASAGQVEIEAHSVDPADVRTALKTAGLIINATSVGMHPRADEAIIDDPGSFRQGQLLLDTVYNPCQTRLMAVAQQGGARVVNGMDMLVYQGAKSFEIWSGISPPVDVMRAAIEGRLS